MYTKEEGDFKEKEAMPNLCATNGRTEQCCVEHKERLQLFCKDDETFICVLCVPRHSSHSFLFLHEAISVYKDKIKTTLTSLESKVKQFKYMQNHHEKEIRDIKEDVFNLEKYIKQQFAELHQFLLDKEQQLIQQLKTDEANTLKWMEGNLECIKQEIVTDPVTYSDGNLEDKIKEEDILKVMEENVKFIENDAIAIKGISHSDVEIRQPEPVSLLTVPETFEDVTVTFTEEEWKLLRKQDKELYRDVMAQNYETCVSVGMKSTDCNVNCSQQPPLVRSHLHNPARNLQQRSQPGENIDKVYLTHVPQLPSEHHCYQTPECDNGTPVTRHLTEHLLPHTQSVKVCDKLSLTPNPRLNSVHGCSRSSEHDTTKRFHTKKERHKCAECMKSFTCASSLKRHQVIHTGLKPYKCTECSKCFTQLSSLQTHCAIHTGMKPHKCIECGMSFVWAGNLKRHHVIHTGMKPYKCTECSKCFTQLRRLQQHLVSHTRVKKYKCTECSECFTQLSNFQKHYAIHTGLKPYKCTECSKGFTRLRNLRAHRVIHTGMKPHKCTECDKSFIWACSLRRHKVIHTVPKPYQCSECSKCFSELSSLQRHYIIHTELK